jgi:acetylornithine deacetylase/succinyl-diaminopimelate desuccinylase-like protein
MNIEDLKRFIRLKSIVNNEVQNRKALEFIIEKLSSIGFTCEVKGEDETDQPCLVAHFSGINSDKKIVIYGHYDVAEVKGTEDWISEDPFELQEINGRFYARGIADNKGPLFARMEAVSEMISEGVNIPEILWLIQGEEEVEAGGRVAKSAFEIEIEKFDCNIFFDETGFNDIDSQQQIVFLWSPGISENNLVKWKPLFIEIMDAPRIEFRHLNKLNGINDCPLLGSLSKDSVYIGFGPNDKLHQIHRENESLDTERLNLHKQQFKSFIGMFAEYSCNE